jgi:hypothetical protein
MRVGRRINSHPLKVFYLLGIEFSTIHQTHKHKRGRGSVHPVGGHGLICDRPLVGQNCPGSGGGIQSFGSLLRKVTVVFVLAPSWGSSRPWARRLTLRMIAEGDDQGGGEEGGEPFPKKQRIALNQRQVTGLDELGVRVFEVVDELREGLVTGFGA